MKQFIIIKYKLISSDNYFYFNFFIFSLYTFISIYHYIINFRFEKLYLIMLFLSLNYPFSISFIIIQSIQLIMTYKIDLEEKNIIIINLNVSLRYLS